MKRLLILSFFSLMLIQANAQLSNVILFTENGERFTSILNGVRQNDQHETNVKITGLNAEFYKLKIIFENTAFGEKNFNLGLELGKENTYVIKKNNKGEYVLRFMSSVAMSDAPRNTPSQAVVVYNINPVASPVQNSNSQQSVTTTTSTSQTGAANNNPGNVNVNMGVNVDGMGGNISINMSGMDGGLNEQGANTVTHSQTTITTTSTSSPGNVNQMTSPAPIAYLPGYNGPIGCPVPVSNEDFAALKSSIASKSFEETKFTIAKQILNDRCLFVSQVKQLMLEFSFEQTRLDFAKYAYDKTYDIGNYFKVNDAFTFENSTDELNEYINSRR